MGCSGSTISTDDNKKLSDERSLYTFRNEKLEAFAQDILDDAIKMNNGTSEGIDKMIFYISAKKAGINAMKLIDIKEALRDLYVQQFLLSAKIIQELDMGNEFEERFINHNTFTNEIKDNINIILQNIFVNYQRSQTCAYINFDPQYFLEDPSLESSFFSNFKFNKSFQVDCLCFNFSQTIISKFNLCIDFADIISCNKSLVTVIIQIKEDVDSIMNLLPILQAIVHHNAIQMVVLKAEIDKISLTTQIEDCIVELLKTSKNLIGLCLCKFNFSDEFMVNMEKMMPYAPVLRVIMIESKYCNMRVMDEFVGRGIGRCNNLIAGIIGGFGLYEAKRNEYSQLKKGNTKLKLLEFLDKIIMF